MLFEGAGSSQYSSYPRVAFLPDTFHEINGVAHTSRQLEQFARRRRIPFLSIHCGPCNEIVEDGPVVIMQVTRGPASVELDAHLEYDPFLMRYANRIAAAIKEFRADLIHVTGPGDMGLLGLYVAWKLHLPLVISWHTSLHEYAQLRLERLLAGFGKGVSQAAGRVAEKFSLGVLKWFYRKGRVLLAPNDELVQTLRQLTGLPVFLMQRGVDAELFSPLRRTRLDGPFCIGYVGRLTPEKNVRFVADLARGLQSNGLQDFSILLVGQGSEEPWLREHVPNVSFTGVLRGEPLAEAYANMDIFVFPSKTDTFGNAVLEALSSGLPAVVTAEGGPKWLVQDGATGYVAPTDEDFIRRVMKLMTNPIIHHSMAEAARQYAVEQSWDKVFERLFTAYDTCLPSAPLLASGTSR